MFWIFRKKTPIEKLCIRDREIRKGLERALYIHIPDGIDTNVLHHRLHEMLVGYASEDDLDADAYSPHDYDKHASNIACAGWRLDVFCAQAIEIGSAESHQLATDLAQHILETTDAYFREADLGLRFTEEMLLMAAPDARPYLYSPSS